MPETRRPSSAPSATAERAPTRTFWPPSDWSLRRKVVAALALPLIFAMVLVGFSIGNAWSDTQAASKAQTRYGALLPAIDYLASSQDLATQLFLTKPSQKGTDSARATFKQAESNLQTAIGSSGLSGKQRNLLSSAISMGDSLKGTAEKTSDTASLAPGAISSDVLAFIDDLNAVHPEATLNVLHDLVTAQTHLGDERMDLAQADSFSDELRTQLSADVGGESDALQRVQAAELPTVDVSAQQSATGNRLTLSTNGTLDQVKQTTPSVTSSYQPAYKAAVAHAIKRISQQTDDARRSALEQIALVIALFMLTVLFAVLISRTLLVRPIARLRRSTIDVSREHLPAAIERVQSGQGVGRIKSVALNGREEIGQLSRAIDGMQNRAIRLASEQATLRRQMTEMFETLSRRNTSLVNQQLNLLEELENDEDNPVRLDSLFRLDHMAARMRRNGQSLMVLAGNDDARGRGQALAVAEVVGAAVSEVQDYQRVHVGQLPDHVIDDQTATDLVHIVAELVDNALGYSPPDSPVEITGTTDGGDVVLEIQDHGLGIEADEVESLNDEIEDGGTFGVETTRHMGLFVVGRLSASHGIQVGLRSRPKHGTTVVVRVPATVLSLDEASSRSSAAAAVQRQRAASGPMTLGAALAESTGSVATAVAEETREIPGRDRAITGELPRRQPGATTGELPRRQPGSTGASAFTPIDSRRTSEPFAAESTTGSWASPVGTPPPADPARARGASSFFSASRSAREYDADATTTKFSYTGSNSVATTQDSGSTNTSSGSSLWSGGAGGSTSNGSSLWSGGSGSSGSSLWSGGSSYEPTDGNASPDAGHQAPRPAPEEDTPIFRQMSSRWLTTDSGSADSWSSEPADRAWQAAEAATDEHHRSTDTGSLPQRRPGQFIVPGSATPTFDAMSPAGGSEPAKPTMPMRDPDSVRAKLSRYKAGVERGRNSASSAVTDDPRDNDNGSRNW